MYRKDGASYTFLTVGQTVDRLDAGQRGIAIEFETRYGRIEGAETLVARADDWGTDSVQSTNVMNGTMELNSPIPLVSRLR